MIVDAAPVLGTPVVALPDDHYHYHIVINMITISSPRPVEGGGVHPVEEHGEELLVGDQVRVEEHLDGLGVPGVPVTDVLVGGVELLAGGVAHHAAHHPRHSLEGQLDPPETS